MANVLAALAVATACVLPTGARGGDGRWLRLPVNLSAAARAELAELGASSGERLAFVRLDGRAALRLDGRCDPLADWARRHGVPLGEPRSTISCAEAVFAVQDTHRTVLEAEPAGPPGFLERSRLHVPAERMPTVRPCRSELPSRPLATRAPPLV